MTSIHGPETTVAGKTRSALRLFKARWSTDFRYPAHPFIKGHFIMAHGEELSFEFHPQRKGDDYGIVFFSSEDGEAFACRVYTERKRIILSHFYASEPCYEDLCKNFARNKRSFAEKLGAVLATNVKERV